MKHAQTVIRHAQSDVKYVDGLEAHIKEGGEVTPKNVADLIAMVRWNAEEAIAASANADELWPIRARLWERPVADTSEEILELRGSKQNGECVSQHTITMVNTSSAFPDFRAFFDAVREQS